MKSLVFVLSALLFTASAIPAMAAPLLLKRGIYRFPTHAELVTYGAAEGTFAYAQDSNTGYLRQGGSWVPTDPNTKEFNVYFDDGAGKVIQLAQSDGTAYDHTAATLNLLYYGEFTFGVNQIVQVGTATPAMEATGLDIVGGDTTDNDHMAYFAGELGASGHPWVPNSDPAFKTCAKVKIHDVSGTDGFFIGFATTEPATVAVASYTDYCGISLISGNIEVSDKTNGDTDTTDNIVDDDEKTYCTLVSSAGACTYTVDGVAPTTVAAHTLTSKVSVIPRIQIINTTDIADDTHLEQWEAVYQ